ncbi:MAG TPA: ABC transporter substrate-binding protein [Erysipelotrichaceae bacterium]|jgi:branched-chain amino acid transport system substrate-binding protein|nr:ABC transporter substrate-binding protein [Erysipelotrichia bacterium]HPX33004.1 ABC transporter substrate-binding protein [Erysipelotrichaceae bacterium]HQA85540.1 ABC transporter substrate-binding protein [Erysipelotrichaceae bacterium]
MKKFITLLLVSLLALSTLAGCNNGGKKDEPKTIKIGASGPLTGGAAIYGQAVKNGAMLAIAEINAKNGLQLDFKMEDDEADSTKADTAYDVLLDWGMQVSLFTVTSGAGTGVAPRYDEDHIFALTPSGSATTLVYSDTKVYETTFQMCFSDPNQGVGAADYIKDHNLGTKVAIIYKSDCVYSTGIMQKFVARADEIGLEIVFQGAFDDSSATDFTTQLQGAKAAGADLLFLPIYYEPASSILKQASDMGYAPIFFGVDGMDGILTMKGFDTSLAEGVYLLTPFAADATDDLTVHFVTEYQKAYGEIPNQFAADAYDAVYALYKALVAGNVTYDMNAKTIADIMIAQFTTMTFDGVTGTNVTWSANGEVSKAPKAVVITNGVYVNAE